MLKKQIIRAVGGLNTDDDPRYLSEGDYLKMLNMRVGSNQGQGDRGLVETFLSHYKMDFPGATPGTFTVLAVAKEEEHDRAYMLCYEGTGSYFQIFKYNLISDAITKIYQATGSSWGINASTKIYNPRIIDSKLVFTDNATPIKYIDLTRLENSYLNGIGLSAVSKWVTGTTYAQGAIIYWKSSYYSSTQGSNQGHQPDLEPTYWTYLCKILEAYGDIVDPDNFMLAAQPPLLAVTPQYINTAGRNANNLRQQIFQVTYRYVYIDYRKSTFAPPSIVPSPNNEETIDGQLNLDPTYHNGLSITLNTGSEEVRSIEVVGRNSADPASWFLMEEILIFDRDGARVYDPEQGLTIYWYNDSTKTLIDSTELYTLFTYIPITAKHMELIEGNRLSFANMIEGYNRIQAFTNVELAYEDLVSSNIVRQALSVTKEYRFIQYQGLQWAIKLTLPQTPQLGLYHVELFDDGDDITYIAEYTWDGSGSYPDTVRTGLIVAMGAANPVIPVGSGWWPPDAYSIAMFVTGIGWDNPYNDWDFSLSYREYAELVAVNKYPCLKSGTSQNYGVIYRDNAGRISPIIGVNEITKYIPQPAESGSVGINQIPVVDFYITHLPPSWAESYEIVYSGNKTISWFLQLVGYNINWGKKMNNHTDPNYTTNYDNRNMRICVEEMYSRTRGKIPGWSVEEYVWQEGDRIRLIGTINQTGVVTERTTVYDAEITGVFKDTDYTDFYNKTGSVERNWLYFQRASGEFPTNLPVPTRQFPDYIIEIYRPYKEFTTTLFYTTGMTFQVATDGYGHKYHKGDTDQVLDAQGVVQVQAIVRNLAHDTWKYLRTYVDKVNDQVLYYWCESEYASDFYLADKLTSAGFPIPDLYSFKQSVLPKRIRHGGLYNFGTELNNIAKFDYDDYEDVKDEFGPIEGIREVGFILKVIQYNKISSIYLSRTEAYSPSGSQQFLFTDKVFGTLRPGMEKYGTRHPESVIVHNEYLYFWDQTESAVIRDAANGVIAISKYKMMRFFTDKAKELEAAGFSEGAVRFAYNVHDDNLHCTFFNGSTYETLIFSELDQRWKYSTDAKIDKPFWFGRRMFHVSQGSIYEWWRTGGTGFLRLSNEVKSAQVIVCATEDPMKSKTYKAVAVYQTGAVPSVAVKIPAKSSAVARDQETIATNWEKIEGIYYGEIMRDVNTPGMTGTDNKYMNGIRLRGQYVQITLTVTETSGVVRIYNVMVNSTDSERSM